MTSADDAWIELWTHGTDAFGYRFRDAWHVVGWEEGRVASNFVCKLSLKLPLAPVAAINPKQMELFA